MASLHTSASALAAAALAALVLAGCGAGNAPEPTAVEPGKPEENVVTAVEDPYIWLEDVEGEKALDWVRAQNAASKEGLESIEGFAELRDDLRAILDSNDKIPFVREMGGQLYNFWQDANNPRGLWRRTTLESYRSANPQWEVILDLDALNKAEGENWVWAGQLPAPRLHPLPALAVARRCRRQCHPRVRHRHQVLRRGRLLPPRSQGRHGLDRPRYGLRVHRLRRRLDDQLGLSAHRQALEARHRARQRRDGVRRPGR
jgi:hypothetical protein